jgi:hypothetical protein
MTRPEPEPGFVQVLVLARGDLLSGPTVAGIFDVATWRWAEEVGPHTSAKRTCFVDLIVPTLSKPSGCP